MLSIDTHLAIIRTDALEGEETLKPSERDSKPIVFKLELIRRPNGKLEWEE